MVSVQKLQMSNLLCSRAREAVVFLAPFWFACFGCITLVSLQHSGVVLDNVGMLLGVPWTPGLRGIWKRTTQWESLAHLAIEMILCE